MKSRQALAFKFIFVALGVLLFSVPLISDPPRELGFIAVGYDKVRYEGENVDGVAHGKGVLTSADGRRYEGTFVRGKAEGYGKIIFPNGTVYEGEIKNNYADGSGKAYSKVTKYAYMGDWKEGRPHGKGSMTLENGDVYIGEFSQGYSHGQGRVFAINGSTYIGSWEKGKQSGFGILEWKTGINVRYEGEFKKGKRNGTGVMKFRDGKVYKGQFVEDEAEGYGEVYDDKGNLLVKGIFKKSKLIKRDE